MTPIPLTVRTGVPTGPMAPDYVDLLSKENLQQINNTKIQQGHSATRGVILTQDTINVPLETAFGINNERSETSRPTLMPLFRTRYVEMPKLSNFIESDYAVLRNQLPTELREALESNEKLPFKDQDPDLIALDQSLQFEASRRTLIKILGNPPVDQERALADAVNFIKLPEMVSKNILNYGYTITNCLDRYLGALGPNDPSYDLLLKTSNQIKELLQEYRGN